MKPTRVGVLQISPFFLFEAQRDMWDPRFDPLGGMQIMVHSLAMALSRRGISQVVLTMGIPGAPRDLRLNESVIVHSRRFAVLPIPSSLEGYFGLVLAYVSRSIAWVWANRTRLRREIGVVHVHCDGSGAVPWLGRTAARILNVPLVMQIHCCRTLTQVPTTLWEAISDPMAKRSEQQCLQAAARVITLTTRLRDRLMSELGVTSEKLVKVAYMAHSDFRSADTPELRAEIAGLAGLIGDKPTITYLGRVAAEKGVEYFVEAAALLNKDRDYRYLLIGDGPELEAIRSKVADAGLSGRFHFTGFIPPSWVASALSHATVGVVPSRYEEFGLVLPEYMLMQVPVVSVDVGGIGETIRHDRNGMLVPPGDPAAIADRVRQLVDDPQLRARITSQGARDAENYSFERGMDAFLHVYSELDPRISHGG